MNGRSDSAVRDGSAAAPVRPASKIPEVETRRVVIEHVGPHVDDGRFPIKRTIGEAIDVVADIFADGHDLIAARLRHRRVSGPGIGDSGVERETPTASTDWRELPMQLVNPGNDEWSARFEVDEVGWHEYSVIGWVDRFRTWRRDLQVKFEAGQDVALELVEGSLLIGEHAARAQQIGSSAADANWLLSEADALSDATPVAERVARVLHEDLATLMDTYADRSRATTSEPLRVWVDRERARFGAWYEMFPRSLGPDPTRSATFAEAARHLCYVADLGFDVVYLTPIHPIGHSFRKGANNSLQAGPDDPGSPWAIGSEAGGHTAIEPGLGTFDDFTAFCEEAERLGLEVALDLAWQCSPDHPWVREHPEWFRHRPDGSIKYAENPPKKYHDIYPFDFESEDWQGLWHALLDVTLFWVDRGIRIFRVDNPHTKTFGFWEWLIDRVHAHDPGVVLLSEAFTRPKPMRRLAKEGFSQSYTYFTWLNTKAEITEYFTELTQTEVREYLRPNLFANTPDILHAYLQEGGRPAFEARLLLAATLAASYGIYSGFELTENRALKPGSEEYASSEKYQFRHWDWDRPGHIKELVARVNQIRHQQTALQFDRTLRFHETDNPQIIAYSKHAPDDEAAIVYVIVNLDPHNMQHGHVRVPDVADEEAIFVEDLLDDARYRWRGAWNYVRLDPGVRQGHVFRIERQV